MDPDLSKKQEKAIFGQKNAVYGRSTSSSSNSNKRTQDTPTTSSDSRKGSLNKGSPLNLKPDYSNFQYSATNIDDGVAEDISGSSPTSTKEKRWQPSTFILYGLKWKNWSAHSAKEQTSTIEINDSSAHESITLKKTSFSIPELSFIESKSCEACKTKQGYTPYMCDEKRRIDFVLVNNFAETSVSNVEKRDQFEKSLCQEGLELESFVDTKYLIRYLKIHAPWETLATYAERLKYDMPIMKNDLSSARPKLVYGKYTLPPVEHYFTAAFTRASECHFLIQDKNTFFSSPQRSAIVDFILKRAVFIDDFDSTRKVHFGLEKLRKENIYSAAYPLHDGGIDGDVDDGDDAENLNLRRLLYQTWGRFACFFQPQPLDHIRLYFGESFGFFFAWVGLYTEMLIPLSVFGVYVLIYGVVYMVFTEETNEVCDKSGIGNITMCPGCKERCNFWKMRDSCLYSKAENLLDNELTIVFSILIVLWSYAFIEVWKRHENQLIQAWSMNNFLKNELIRPQYITIATSKEVNPITAMEEPVIPREVKYLRKIASMVFMLFSAIITILAFVLVIYTRKKIKDIAYYMEYGNTKATLISSVGGTIFFILVFSILELIFIPLAKQITNYEAPRTESGWEESYIVKAFVFRFLGNIIYIIYVAFIRDWINPDPNKNTKTGGLKIELFGSVTTLIVGQQMGAVLTRLAMAKFYEWIKQSRKKGDTLVERGYTMLELPEQYLADEYIGFVLQYGMVTCFAALFPFCAVCALITNLVLIRFSAYGILVYYRRPVTQRLHGIGIWITILTIISKIAAITNAFLIVFSSEFIKRQVYIYDESEEHYGLTGYIEFSLYVENASNFKPEDDKYAEEKTCMVRGFKHPYNATNAYSPTAVYWKVQSAKYLFVIFFTIFVELFHTLVFVLEPHLEKKVQVEQMREAYLTHKLFNAKMLSEGTQKGNNRTKRAAVF